VLISDEITVYFIDNNNNNNNINNNNTEDHHTYLKIKHLPPITINFLMTKNYPNDEILQFSLECCWLTNDYIRQLEKQFEKIWQEEKDVVCVLFFQTTMNYIYYY
jgi:hypothetical protein